MADGLTYVIDRRTTNPEHSWIGCEGTHTQNAAKILYRAATDPNRFEFMNSQGGANLFIRI